MSWIKTSEGRPPANEIVDTKIDHEDGETPTNQQKLKMHATGKLWWLPDSSMYVYYTPTHWKDIS